MSNHNGHLVKPTDADRRIIHVALQECASTRLLFQTYIKTIESKHLFLETEMVNLNWILTHLQEAEKELKRLKGRVQDVSD